jgi:hypothetical protein
MKRSLAYLIALCLPLMACSTVGLPTPKTPAQSVFELKATEGAALAIAVQYRNLPPCPTAAPICKTANVLTSLQAADNVAAGAIDNAERLVRDPAFKDAPTTVKALEAANAAVVALTTLTATLKVK